MKALKLKLIDAALSHAMRICFGTEGICVKDFNQLWADYKMLSLCDSRSANKIIEKYQ